MNAIHKMNTRDKKNKNTGAISPVEGAGGIYKMTIRKAGERPLGTLQWNNKRQEDTEKKCEDNNLEENTGGSRGK
jgi:hypothetical protein